MKILKSTFILSIVIIFIFSSKITAQTSLSPNNSDIIKGMYDSVAKGDFPAFLNAMDPNIEWNEAENFPYADGNPYIGPNAIAEGVFKRIGADWEYWTLSDIELHETKDNKVIATGYYNAKNKETGKVIKAQYTHHWSLENGKVTRFQQYSDTYQVTKAMENVPGNVINLRSEKIKTDNEAYKKTMDRLIEDVWNNQNLDILAEVFTEDAVLHLGGLDYNLKGIPNFRENYMRTTMIAFPDIQHGYDKLIIDGNMIAMIFYGEGTHKEEYDGIPGTNKVLHYRGMAFFRMEGNRIAEVWTHSNWATQFAELTK